MLSLGISLRSFRGYWWAGEMKPQKARRRRSPRGDSTTSEPRHHFGGADTRRIKLIVRRCGQGPGRAEQILRTTLISRKSCDPALHELWTKMSVEFTKMLRTPYSRRCSNSTGDPVNWLGSVLHSLPFDLRRMPGPRTRTGRKAITDLCWS